MPGAAHPARDGGRGAGRRGLGGHRRAAQGDRRRPRGDLDDHAQLDRRSGSAATCSRSTGRCRTATLRSNRFRSPTTSWRAPSCPSSGATPSCRACTSGSSSRSPPWSSSGSLLNRSTTGYEVRAVGFNPEAARYGGINVGRNYVLVMAICGAFAGLAASMDILGWEFHVVHQRHPRLAGRLPRHRGRAAGPQHGERHCCRGAALRRAADRHLAAQPGPDVFEPELASNLTIIIQGLVVLLVSTDVIALTMLRRGRSGSSAGRPASR